MPGELQDGRVIVRDQSEGNRIYNKGGFGRPLSGGALELDLVEAAFLLSAGRLAMSPPHEDLAAFLAAAGEERPEFGVEFLAYRDLREQRADVRLAPPSLRAHGIQFRCGFDGKAPAGPRSYVRAASERAPVTLAELILFADRVSKDAAEAVVAVVDEESEVTQYRVDLADPRGRRPPVEVSRPARGVLLRDRVFVAESPEAKLLHEREFLGKPAAGGYYVSLVEALHLLGRGALHVRPADSDRSLKLDEFRREARRIEPGLARRSALYEDLKARHLVAKTGYKFGTHFRAYEEEPTATHAPYLVEALEPKAVLEWPQLSRAIRLSHGVRKSLLLAEVGPRPPRYLRVRRLG